MCSTASYFTVLITLVCPLLCGLDADRAESGCACPADSRAPAPSCEAEGEPAVPDGAPCPEQTCLCSPFLCHLPKPGQPDVAPDDAPPAYSAQLTQVPTAGARAHALQRRPGEPPPDSHPQPGHGLHLLI